MIKPHDAGRGHRVFRARGARQARRVLERLRAHRGAALVQAYIRTGRSPRFHYRVDVIDGRAVTGGVAYARRHPWLTNEARGGRFVFSPNLRLVPQPVQDLAVRAVAAVGAEFSGVDIMEDRSGDLYVLEANEGPLFDGPTAVVLAEYLRHVARTRRP